MNSWIKVRTSLRDDPRVMSMADSLGVTDAEIIGALVIFWSWADSHTEDGIVRNLSASRADKVATLCGFSAELVRIGWAKIDEKTDELSLKNFYEHNGNSAKRRASEAKRKAATRSPSKSAAKCPQSVRIESGQNAELEKRREEKRRDVLEANASCPKSDGGESQITKTRDMLEEFWQKAPAQARNRSSKAKVEAAWNQLPKSKRPEFPYLLEALEAWKKSEEWLKDGGKYIAGIHIFIKSRKWEALPECQQTQIDLGGREAKSITKL